MIVCHCKGLTDRDIREAVRRGNAELNHKNGEAIEAGRACGGCRPLVDEIIIRASADLKERRKS